MSDLPAPPPAPSLLIANRGEIAVRIHRAAAGLGLRTVAVHAPEDRDAAHVRIADDTRPLPGAGPAAYLDAKRIAEAARDAGCSLVHPGYGFLSEDAGFARLCADSGLVFIGPSPEALELFGDKTRSRALAEDLGVPVLPATAGPTTLEEARSFLAGLGPGAAVMVKALAGGGGRGMRPVSSADDLPFAYRRCASEAEHAFGRGELYVERLLPRARHIEVQVLGDGADAVHLWERDCSLQRRNQKLIEAAPAPGLDPRVRRRLLDAALAMARATGYSGLGTFEFLLDADDPAGGCYFLEANPRLQVEHTVTEELTGVDLVAAQIRTALGATLAEQGLTQDAVGEPAGSAVQVRVNLETVGADGQAAPASGTLTAFAPPTGPGVRVDTHGRPGHRAGDGFDPLLAKVVAHAPRGTFAEAADRAERALAEFQVEGADTSLPLLRAVLRHPGFRAGGYPTSFLADHFGELAAEAGLDAGGAPPDGGEGLVAAPFAGTVVAVEAAPGDPVRAGAPLVVIEAMKMEHVLPAPAGGTVAEVRARVGATVAEGEVLARLTPGDGPAGEAEAEPEAEPAEIRPDLAEVIERHEIGLDARRPGAVERRRARGRRTARENIADLCVPESFTEYGALAVAAQRRRRPLAELIAETPADGMVTGTGRVDGGHGAAAECVVMSYDYTVLAGTQGVLNHRKTDRMLELAHRRRLPVVLFAEGGGGRPGDTDTTSASGLDVTTFAAMGRLSGRVPTVGIASGRCFAGNAALLGCCDVVIATEEATIGMGGPAMIEGGGLGRFRPEEVGPARVQHANGVVDLLVADDAAAVRAARDYLSYFQGPRREWDCADQRLLRSVVPENRVRAYDVRRAVHTLADTGSVLELRGGFGRGVITALVRIEGRPMGLIANDPAHLGGAVDADAADKTARFLQLCDAHGLPLVSLCDTPGFMVGPDAERTATVRHFARLFVIGSHLRVPMVTVVLRKGYGLGAQAMAGGHFRAPQATVAWPTGEVGAMGLEGAVRLGYRRELEAAGGPEQRARLFDELLAEHYDRGKAVNAAAVFELDDVIDPADTRRWITAALSGAGPGDGSEARYIDTW
ncbi:carboxyl transferase domain-containing protein [Nocardiopsis composta]|uniref:Acetyl/propionyl-CoA carboxylase alpha subunit n=1 Tax=Nocardiopsis composta TaxID=157465 RepID=A0A7W8QI06_9ACTN|nr:carboxyl transferase domain-containing protein [Nocardiopsis composta]MBB5430640.1 acetyl/propionyl-CoA carboxylase alpha subunit [Nocardiopsis composta]